MSKCERCGYDFGDSSTQWTVHAEVMECVGVLQMEVERLRADRGTCEWRYDDTYGSHDTSCGEAFQFNDGGVAENVFTHCPFCGGRIQEAAKAAKVVGGDDEK